jgi:hypothetical protein
MTTPAPDHGGRVDPTPCGFQEHAVTLRTQTRAVCVCRLRLL